MSLVAGSYDKTLYGFDILSSKNVGMTVFFCCMKVLLSSYPPLFIYRGNLLENFESLLQEV